MKSLTPTQDEMKSRIARFKDIVPVKSLRRQDLGIPEEVFEMQTAKITRNIMSPGVLPGQLSPKPVVEGGDAGVFRLGIVTCPPNTGPGLHVHYKTHETFMALTGRVVPSVSRSPSEVGDAGLLRRTRAPRGPTCSRAARQCGEEPLSPVLLHA